jgi:hypothetical protein
MAAIAPSAIGIGRRRWNNIRSLCWNALRSTGALTMPGRQLVPLSEKWQRLWKRLPSKWRIELSRFFRFCSAANIEPDAVDDGVLEMFAKSLLEESLLKEPRRAHLRTARRWNDAVIEIPAWPQHILTLPPTLIARYSLPWSCFPNSFYEDVEAWSRTVSGADIAAPTDRRPVRKSSLDQWRSFLRRIASAAVLSGHPPESIRSLADLVAVDRVSAGLKFLQNRWGGRITTGHRDIAYLLLGIARDWVRVDKDHASWLRRICRRTDPGTKGLTAKNRAWLRQLDDPANVALLVNLPQRLVQEAERKYRNTKRGAHLVELALIVEILLMAPMRVGSLTRLSLQRNILRSRSGRLGAVHFVLEGADVKNSEPIEYPLPPETVDVLDLYLSRYRRLLMDSPTDFLFPGRSGKRRRETSITDKVSTGIRRYTGLDL